jgi:hypothetical protein
VPGVSWYLHVVEAEDGHWSCRHGRTVLDTHTHRTDAIDHLQALALELELGTEIFVHARGGVIEKLE